MKRRVKFYPLDGHVPDWEYDIPDDVEVGDTLTLHQSEWRVMDVSDTLVGVA